MPALVVRLAISAERMLAFYRGRARQVVAVAEDGRTVRFPAEALRPHVRADGVHGRFLVRFDANHRLIGVERLG